MKVEIFIAIGNAACIAFFFARLLGLVAVEPWMEALFFLTIGFGWGFTLHGYINGKRGKHA